MIVVEWLLEDFCDEARPVRLLREIRDEAGNVARYDRSQGMVAEGSKGRPAFIWADNIAC